MDGVAQIAWILGLFFGLGWLLKPGRIHPAAQVFAVGLGLGGSFVAVCLACVPWVDFDPAKIWWAAPPATFVACCGGIAFARLHATRLHLARFGALTPALIVWGLAGPTSVVVLENRIAPPEWRDGVCLQTTTFTCTAVAGATLLNALGVETTEMDMANACDTTAGGTTVRGLAKGLGAKLRNRVTAVPCSLTLDQVEEASLPLIAFTKSHALVVFAIEDDVLEIGEGGQGRHRVSWEYFVEVFNGDAVILESPSLADLVKLEPPSDWRYGSVSEEVIRSRRRLHSSREDSSRPQSDRCAASR